MTYILYENNYFSVGHCDTHAIAGYVIVSAKNEIHTIAEMSDEQSNLLAQTIKISQQAISKVIGPERIYCLTFCEVLPKFHMHLFPRTKKLLVEYRNDLAVGNEQSINGALLFDWARQKYNYPLDAKMLKNISTGLQMEIKNLQKEIKFEN